MKVKVGDTVKIIYGKDKGKEGKVIKTFKHEDKLLVEAINVIKKHQKPNNTNETGGIVEKEAPIHVSNVKVLSSSNNKKESKKDSKTKEVKEEPKKEKTVKKTTAKKAK